MPEHTWRQQAACTGHDPETFFATDPTSIDQAKAICARCPVREPCLRAALEPDIDNGHHEPRPIARYGEHGIWGGLTPTQRHRLARRYAAQTGCENSRQQAV